MENQFDTMTELGELLDRFEEQRNALYACFAGLVSQILAGRITDQTVIEQIADRLADFGDDARFWDLYKGLCRYVYDRYPQMVGAFGNYYRLLEDAIFPEESTRSPAAATEPGNHL